MRRVLLIGQDPLFAWALEKTIANHGYRLEHVYTLGEASLRMHRFHYDFYLLDGLTEQEINSFSIHEEDGSSVFVLEDIRVGTPVTTVANSGNRQTRIPKERALSSIISTLQQNS